MGSGPQIEAQQPVRIGRGGSADCDAVAGPVEIDHRHDGRAAVGDAVAVGEPAMRRPGALRRHGVGRGGGWHVNELLP